MILGTESSHMTSMTSKILSLFVEYFPHFFGISSFPGLSAPITFWNDFFITISMKNLGIILIVLGAIMMVVTGFNYVTREKVVDIGALQIRADKNHPVQWSPIVGGILLVAGVAVMLGNKNK